MSEQPIDLTHELLRQIGAEQASRRQEAQVNRQASRFASAPGAFGLLAECAARRSRITYADFADELGLGSPRGLGWLLTPLLAWCGARHLPPLPIIVVRRVDGLPSGGYDRETVATETARVFDYPWRNERPPTAVCISFHALPNLPVPLRRTLSPQEAATC